VLAPAAAHLAAGVPLEDLGEPVDPDSLARLSMPEPNIERGRSNARSST
jgi:S-adenosylmethionine hydrolase